MRAAGWAPARPPSGADGEHPAADVLRSVFPDRLAGMPMRRDDPIGIGHPFFALLRGVLASSRADAPWELIGQIRTWGDVYDWFGDALCDRQQPAADAFGSLVRLRPILPDDVPRLYSAALDPAVASVWRYRGHTVSFADFERSLFEGVLTQYMVETVDGAPQGLATLYSADLANGHAWLALLRSAHQDPKPGAMILGAAQLLVHAFSAWPLRKVYVEMPAHNEWLISDLVAAGVAKEEGRLVGHFFSNGVWVDKVIAAMYREPFLARFAGWFAAPSP